jgi:hypothetical protein
MLERAAERFRQPEGRAERTERTAGEEGRSGQPERTAGEEGRSGQPERTGGAEERLDQPERSDGPSGQARIDLLAQEMDRLSARLERAKIAEYVDLLNRPLSLVWRNFVGGMARGIGIAIGFTFFAATILYVLQMLGKLNLPIIGDYIADIVRIVQRQLEGRAY